VLDLDDHLAAIVAGDADAFGRWLTGAEGPLRDSLRRLAASVDAEAVLQDALLRAWQVAPRLRPDGRPNGLLRMAVRIARNLALSELRRTRDLPEELDNLERALALDGDRATPRLPDPMLRAAIEKCREALPGKPAQALAARLESGGGVPDRTLAAKLGMQLNTFLQNFGRARKLLAECLGARGIDLDSEAA
jgi:RNA polymerase sigma-70 factor (ECF subfamily)